MKRLCEGVVLAVVVVGVVGLALAGPRGGQDRYADRFLICFRPQVQGVKVKVVDGLVSTGLTTLDRLIREYGVTALDRWLPSARENDHAGEIYLSHIYRVTFSRKDVEVETVVRAFDEDDHLLYAEVEGIKRPCYAPNDPRYAHQWHLPQILADSAWALWTIQGETPGDTTIIIAIVDTGVEWAHPDLVGNIWQNLREDADGDGHTIEWTDTGWALDPGDLNGVDDDDWDQEPETFVDDLIGWDLAGTVSGYDPDNDPMGPPRNYGGEHGTHCAGIASAMTNNGVGVAGAAWRAKIMPVKTTWDQDQDGGIANGDEGIMYAAQAGAHIINCSWGGYGGGASECALITTVHDDYGAVICCSAGNENTADPHYPSACPLAVSVAATTFGDVRAYFSNFGPTIDVCAPGENVLSTVYHDHSGGYEAWGGTSMSSPLVAGAFGLLKAMFPDSSNSWLERRMFETCDNIDPVNPDHAGELGYGRINLYRAIGGCLLPRLSYVSHMLLEVEGDGDGVVEPGESGRLVISLRNEELWLEAVGVTASLQSSDERIEITDSSGSFNDISGGSIGLNLCDPFQVRVLDELDSPVSMELTLEANREGDWPYNELLLFGMRTSVDDELEEGAVPDEWLLAQNYPNPFNPSTEIRFMLPREEWVRLEVYDLLGRRVVTLVDDRRHAGSHQVRWDGSEHASGVYFYRLEAGDRSATKKMLLLK